MDMKHTPTPWRTARSGLHIKSSDSGYLVAVVEGPDRRARGKEWQEDHDYCQGNAAFIVRACNSHEQLVAALESARVAIETSEDQEPQMIAALSAIDAALDAAGAA